MGKVTTGFSMSLDGFIALPDNEIGPLFDWYFTGDLTREMSSGEKTYQLTEDGGKLIEEASTVAGVLVTGRVNFDVAHAWGGKHPMDVPVVVATHNVPEEWAQQEGSPFTFVSGSIERVIASAQDIAGEKSVVIASANVLQQAIRAGLVDEIHIDLVPVLLGEGIRMFDHLEQLGAAPLKLETTDVTPAPGVIHMTFSVVR